LATRDAWLAVNVIVPLVAVAQGAQSVRAAAGLLFSAPIRSETVAGPWSEGRLTLQISRH
jgi:hypothetical protein